MDPKSQSDVAPGAEFQGAWVHTVRRGSLSGSETIAVRSTIVPAAASTLETPVIVGKLFETGAVSRGLAIAFAKLSRPPVEVMSALASVIGS